MAKMAVFRDQNYLCFLVWFLLILLPIFGMYLFPHAPFLSASILLVCLDGLLFVTFVKIMGCQGRFAIQCLGLISKFKVADRFYFTKIEQVKYSGDYTDSNFVLLFSPFGLGYCGTNKKGNQLLLAIKDNANHVVNRVGAQQKFTQLVPLLNQFKSANEYLSTYY